MCISNNTTKILSYSEFEMVRDSLKKQNKKIIQCHGVFDLLHPGHIAHLEEAKNLGDVLVVTVTAAEYVNKGPGRPYFNDELRTKSLAALECVDYVVLSKAVTVDQVMEVVQPDLYVKGSEYSQSNNDLTGNIDKEVAKVRSLGGDVYYTDGVVFSSTKLLNNAFPVMPAHVSDFAKEFLKKYSFHQVREVVESMKDVKVLVLGDIIIDEYIFCNVQGLMSKDRAFSARYDKEERYLGGALAVARHLAGFSKKVTYCGIVGDEPYVHSRMLNDLGKSMLLDLQIDPNFQTVIKRRFVQRRGIREEYEKLFSMNYFSSEEKSGLVNRKQFYDKLKAILPEYDVVILIDYGHDLVDGTMMEIVQEKAPFLAINCQTNSSNYGMNLITKYNRADTFTLDEREIRLAFSNKDRNLEMLLKKLMQHFKGNMGWLTVGSHGSIAIDKSLVTSKNPALTLNVLDTVGAGDAFFAISSLCTYLQAPIEIGSLLGNIAGAVDANILGNSDSVDKGKLLKFASTILNF